MATTTQTDNRDRFQKVAAQRTQAVLERLRLLARCGDSRTYEYNEPDVEEMFAALEAEIATTRRAFDADSFRFGV